MAQTFQTPKTIQSLDVFLNTMKVGTIVRTPGDFNAFSFDEAYRETAGSPILSLSFRAATGGLRKDPRPLAGALPPFFANLLPEDKLREAMEKHHAGNVRPGNDFDLLAALGADLPGAVRVIPSDATTAAPQHGSNGRPKARFSLAGVQMKLSVMKNAGKGGGLTLPIDDEQEQYIAKFPSTAFPGVSENEFANLALAAAIDMEVPERELVEKSDFEGIPEEFDTLSEGKVLLISASIVALREREFTLKTLPRFLAFIRPANNEGAAYHDIAAALNAAVSSASALEFVRRLTLAVMTGNGDMHLKNWSLIYPRRVHASACSDLRRAVDRTLYTHGQHGAFSWR